MHALFSKSVLLEATLDATRLCQDFLAACVWKITHSEVLQLPKALEDSLPMNISEVKRLGRRKWFTFYLLSEAFTTCRCESFTHLKPCGGAAVTGDECFFPESVSSKSKVGLGLTSNQTIVSVMAPASQ